MDLSGTSRDGPEDGLGKRLHYLRSPADSTGAEKANSTARGTGRFSGALTPGHRAMNTLRAAGGCSADRIGVTRATPDPDGVDVGGGTAPESPWLLSRSSRWSVVWCDE